MRLPWIVLFCILKCSSYRTVAVETESELSVPTYSSTIEHHDNETTEELLRRGSFADKTDAGDEASDSEKNYTIAAEWRLFADKTADANETAVEESTINPDNLTGADSTKSRGLFDQGTETNSTLDVVVKPDEQSANSKVKDERVSSEGNGRGTGSGAEGTDRRSLSAIEMPRNSETVDNDNSKKKSKNDKSDVIAEATTKEEIAENATDISSLDETNSTLGQFLGYNEVKEDYEPGAILRIMGEDEEENETELRPETLIEKLKNLSSERRKFLTREFNRLLAKPTTLNGEKNGGQDDEPACRSNRCCGCGCRKRVSRKRISKIVRPIKFEDGDFNIPMAKNVRRTIIPDSSETPTVIPRREITRPVWTSTTTMRPTARFEPTTTEAPITTTEATTTTTEAATTTAILVTSEIAVSTTKKHRRKRPNGHRRKTSVKRVAKKCDRLRKKMRKESSYPEDEEDVAIDEQLTRPYYRGNFEDLEEPIVETADNEFGGAVTEPDGTEMSQEQSSKNRSSDY